jgi:hypothetical protein
MIDIGATILDQIFGGIYFAGTYCIVQRCLPILIDSVSDGAIALDESLAHISVALSRGIEYWCLYIGVNMIHITTSAH